MQMKKTILMLAAALVVSTTAMAQGRVVKRTVMINGKNVSTSDDKKAKDEIDRVVYRITYRTQSTEDVDVQDTARYDYGLDDMRLDIGSKVSKFYSYTGVRHDSLMVAKAVKGDYDFKDVGMPASLSWTLYKNYPEGKALVLENGGAEQYRIEESTMIPEWDIVGDSTKTILGYPCTLATTTFKGRQWRAWYTEEIPLDNGPWKLGGLPGLILSAQDSEAQFIFEAVGLQQLNGSEPITYDKEADKYEAVTYSQFADIKRRTTPGSMLDMMTMGRTTVKVNMYHEDGTPFSDAEMQKWLNKSDPYNPIER